MGGEYALYHKKSGKSRITNHKGVSGCFNIRSQTGGEDYHVKKTNGGNGQKLCDFR